VTNNGNVTACGLIAAQVLLSPDSSTGAGAVALGTLSRKLNLRPGQSVNLRVSFIVPASGDGPYLEGMVSFSGALADQDISNNIFFSDAPLTFMVRNKGTRALILAREPLI
jgi:hypothetical protein